MSLVNTSKCKVHVYSYWSNALNDILLNGHTAIEVEANVCK